MPRVKAIKTSTNLIERTTYNCVSSRVVWPVGPDQLIAMKSVTGVRKTKMINLAAWIHSHLLRPRLAELECLILTTMLMIPVTRIAKRAIISML